VPRKTRTPKAKQPMEGDEWVAFICYDEPDIVEPFDGSAEAAKERFRYLWYETDWSDHYGDEIRPSAWWLWHGPEYLRDFETWLKAIGEEYPEDFKRQCAVRNIFSEARRKYLREADAEAKA
jgi:hypothetical protein